MNPEDSPDNCNDIEINIDYKYVQIKKQKYCSNL